MTINVQDSTLSPQQKRILSLQYKDNTYPLFTQSAVRIEGPLDRLVLEKAIRLVIRKHDALQAKFDDHSPTDPIITFVSGGEFSVDTQFSERLTENSASLQFEIIHQSDTIHTLLLHVPALCADAKTDVMVREIIYAYESEYTDEVISYAEFSEWSNEFIISEDFEFGTQFWRSRDVLQQPEELMNALLPYEEESVPPSSLRVERVIATLSQNTAQAAIALLQGEASLEHVLLTGWQVWFRSVCEEGQATVIAYGCTGRVHDELEGIIGPFAVYVPLASPTDLTQSFQETLLQTSDRAREAQEWQDTFSWEELDHRGGVEASSFFPIGFDYDNFGIYETAGGISFRLQEQFASTDRFKIRLSGTETAGGVHLTLYYDTTRFFRDDMERLLSSYLALLQQAVQEPTTPIAQLTLLNEQEYEKVMLSWNQTANGLQDDVLLHGEFEAQVERTPNLPAVYYEGLTLTYTELNNRANALALQLQQVGVVPDQIVGLYMERSPEVPVAAMGILKAGGAFLSIDPKYPQDRVSFMLEDSKARLLVTQKKFADRLDGLNVQVLVVDTTEPMTTTVPNPQIEMTACHLAYSIFTSGSTGRPKGALIEHRNIVNHIRAVNERIPFGERDSFAYVSTFAADVGLTVLFGSLLTGGCLHIISEELGVDTDGLMDYFEAHQIDFFKIVPSHLMTLMLMGAKPERILPRKFLMLGGEELRWNWVSQLKETGTCRIFNHYGHTEAGVGTFLYEIGEARPTKRAAPVGKPMANTQAYILNANMQPVPIGLPGELYVGGRSVGRGYLNRPELTQEKFVADLFQNIPGAMLYRTGDRMRQLPDGSLQFMERVDHQVKIRGFRVEIGEVELVLEQLSNVQKAIVIARDGRRGEKELAAYLVLKQGAELRGQDVRRHMLDKLPEFMVPSSFTILDTFPLTHNGKIDRKVLPDPEVLENEEVQTYLAPSSPTEEALVEIWQAALKRDQIGVQDNFFNLGGHSLTATKIVIQIREAFQIDLSIRKLFEMPTIEQLALEIEDIILQEIEALELK